MPASMNRRQFLQTAAAGTLAAGCGVPGGRKSTLPEQPNFIVFLADTLRASRLPCYGYHRPTAPHISAFSDANLCFEQCHAVATWTLPATASILTGIHPLLHKTVVTEWSEAGKARGNQYQVLPESIPTTGTILREAGYDTACFQANPNASNERGLGRGATYYHIAVEDGPEKHMDRVLDWLESEAREPFYAYVHLLDPHEPYRADPDTFLELTQHTMESRLAMLPANEAEALRAYHKQTWNTLFVAKDRLDADELRTFSPAAVRYFSLLYDCEIRGIDAQFHRLRQVMRNRDWGSRTVTMITSDHGEAFGEDGQFYHGSFIHDPQTHVPLIIGIPGMAQGQRIPWTVSQLDIHSTLLELAGLAAGAPSSGAPLCDRLGRTVPQTHRPVLTSLDLHRAEPRRWDFGLAAGPLRVKPTDAPFEVVVQDKRTFAPPRNVSLPNIDAVQEAPVRQAVVAYFDALQQLAQESTSVEAPAWADATVAGDEVFRAMGYL